MNSTRLLFIAAMALSSVLQAQPYPNKPVRLVVNSGPSGPSDFLARGLSQVMPPIMGQPFVVENRAGANGIIGAEAAAKSRSEEHTSELQSH